MRVMMDKILFTIKLHSVIDVITNSSTELFVGRNQSKQAMDELIREIYPDYLNEYEELLTIDDLTIEQLNQYFDYTCCSYCFPSSKAQMPIIPGFTFEELYEEDNEYGIAWNGEQQYKLRNNVINLEHEWDYSLITEENFEEMKRRLDPNKEMLFLYSIIENPDWDYQELLMNIMKRIHLG